MITRFESIMLKSVHLNKMKLSFNGATTMKADLETDVRAAAAAGFDYLEIWAAKLREFLKTHSVSDLKALFGDSGLKPRRSVSFAHGAEAEGVVATEQARPIDDAVAWQLEVQGEPATSPWGGCFSPATSSELPPKGMQKKSPRRDFRTGAGISVGASSCHGLTW